MLDIRKLNALREGSKCFQMVIGSRALKTKGWDYEKPQQEKTVWHWAEKWLCRDLFNRVSEVSVIPVTPV